jgi:quinol monooxygenase YgiN
VSGVPGYGTEVAFRLGPGRDDEARAVAAALAAAAAGCRRHVLFLNDAGEYGALAEWGSRDEAEGFASRPATRRVLRDLVEALGKEPSVRVYRMEETPTPRD